VNPTEKRVWQTADTFEQLLKTFSSQMPAPGPFKAGSNRPSALKAMAQKLGFKLSGDSGYDEWMLNFHNFLKENADFQASC
ncbi:Kdo hydroxylase family protein, partial [Vibrio parahaemolyticus]